MDEILRALRGLTGSSSGTVDPKSIAQEPESVDPETRPRRIAIQDLIKDLEANQAKDTTESPIPFETSIWLTLIKLLKSGKPYLLKSQDDKSHMDYYGDAGSSYTRLLNPMIMQPAIKPDPALIFETIFGRNGPPNLHPSKISSILIYLNIIIFHDLFGPDYLPASSKTPYLDLSPLYGNNEDEQKSVRTMKDGTLKPDTFSDIHILSLPPGVATLLICFNRFHNYVAGELAIINESERFGVPNLNPNDPGSAKRLAKRDQDLFETARAITCCLYLEIIQHDYLRTILGLNRTNSPWDFNPRGVLNEISDQPNISLSTTSVEFNLALRWNSCLSEKDERWVNTFYSAAFGKDPNTLTIDDIQQGFQEWAKQIVRQDPSHRSFGDLQRTKAGCFEDADLVYILTESTEDIASSFGPQNIPWVMKAVECLGIEQARSWNVATLNEFRRYLNLKPYEKFSEISTDISIQESLETLYGQPDFVELYPGLIAEDTKHVMIPGSSLCPGFTLSTVLITELLALLCGSRFYTIDKNPATLTNWGFQQVISDPDIAGGGMIYRLLMRAFPSSYRSNSVYALFPFIIPMENHSILAQLGTKDEYNFHRPYPGSVNTVETREGLNDVLNVASLTSHLEQLIGNSDIASSDEPLEGIFTVFCALPNDDRVTRHYESITTKLLHQNNRYVGQCYRLNIVGDVVNPCSATFVADIFGIKLRTPSSPGYLTEITVSTFYKLLVAVWRYPFLESGTFFFIEAKLNAQFAMERLKKVFKPVVESMKVGGLPFSSETGNEMTDKTLQSYGLDIFQRLCSEKSSPILTEKIILLAAMMVAMQSQSIIRVLDLYLSKRYIHHWPEICRLALSPKPEDFAILLHYCLEGLRLSPPSILLRYVFTELTSIDDGERGSKLFQRGDHVDIKSNGDGKDPAIFPNPDEVRLDRPDWKYLDLGFATNSKALCTPIAFQLKAFARLKNLRRAPGPAGRLKTKTLDGTIRYMDNFWCKWGPLPVSMKMFHDGFEERKEKASLDEISVQPALFRDGVSSESKEKDESDAVQVRNAFRASLAKGSMSEVNRLLENHFYDIAIGEMEWLTELLDSGYPYLSIAELLVDEEQQFPWVILDSNPHEFLDPLTDFHYPGCVHQIDGTDLPFQPSPTFQGPTDSQYIAMECIGLAGVVPSSREAVEPVTFSTLDDFITASVSYQWLNNTTLEHICLALDRFCHAFKVLQETGFCCNHFTFLRLRTENAKFQRSQSIELCTVHILDVLDLKNAVAEFQEDRSKSAIVLSLSQKILLEVYQFDLDIAEDVDTALHLAALATQFLSLALLSYLQAHTGYIHPFFLMKPLHRIDLYGCSQPNLPCLSACFHQLTCASGFIRGSVLAFQQFQAHEPDTEIKYDILASAESIVDTWGVGTFCYDSNGRNGQDLVALRIYDGFIIRQSSTEEKLHWFNDSELSDHGHFDMPFQLKRKYLIGGLTENKTCPIDEIECYKQSEHLMHYLNTSETYYQEDAIASSLGLSGGQFAQLSLTVQKTWKRMPGCTMKDKILLHPNYLDISDLEGYWGLQVSLCTGLARRVRLRTLVADLLVDHIESRIPTPNGWNDWKDDLITALKAETPFTGWYRSVTSDGYKQSIVMAIRGLLELLRCTGIRKNDSKLVVAWIPKTASTDLKISHKYITIPCEEMNMWALILEDSVDCATFACITHVCLEHPKHKCRNSSTVAWNSNSELFNTEICIYNSRPEDTKPLVSPMLAPHIIQQGVKYWIGPPDSKLFVKVNIVEHEVEPYLMVARSMVPQNYRERLGRKLWTTRQRIRERGALIGPCKGVTISAMR